MGGQFFLINSQWERWIGHHRSDPSELALVVSFRVTYNRLVLSIIQVMIPPKSLGPYTMWQRLLAYLSKVNSPLRPNDYVIQMAERWATADKLAGRTIIIMGDFNKSETALKNWAEINGLYSMSRHLSTAKCGEAFASFNGTTTVKPSHIDHIYLQRGTPFALTSIGGLMNSLCTLITDHNPSWIGIQWPETPPPLTQLNPSDRILNAPDLPHDDETLALFAHSTDMHLPILLAGTPPNVSHSGTSRKAPR
jgi:hypothetical protein